MTKFIYGMVLIFSVGVKAEFDLQNLQNLQNNDFGSNAVKHACYPEAQKEAAEMAGMSLQEFVINFKIGRFFERLRAEGAYFEFDNGQGSYAVEFRVSEFTCEILPLKSGPSQVD